jgi:hypothetical protein
MKSKSTNTVEKRGGTKVKEDALLVIRKSASNAKKVLRMVLLIGLISSASIMMSIE